MRGIVVVSQEGRRMTQGSRTIGAREAEDVAGEAENVNSPLRVFGVLVSGELVLFHGRSGRWREGGGGCGGRVGECKFSFAGSRGISIWRTESAHSGKYAADGQYYP